MPNEANTCRQYVVPKLQAAGWEDEPHRINEQVKFTDGRIVVTGRQGRRRPGKRADYILRFRPDFPIAVVEAKPTYATSGDGLQQAKDYAEILDLKFAYATNGHGIIEFDYMTGLEREIDTFPIFAQLIFVAGPRKIRRRPSGASPRGWKRRADSRNPLSRG
jgi:type I restriction enzyme, R subunit